MNDEQRVEAPGALGETTEQAVARQRAEASRRAAQEMVANPSSRVLARARNTPAAGPGVVGGDYINAAINQLARVLRGRRLSEAQRAALLRLLASETERGAR
ncbi:hypothetical protein [Streptomyces sp. C10-9-1]|uniref:hypothetical protein n=1 Tax=Streptomyces sp. C10-9-1 TaxID=1859285 RepID=UPI003F49EF12